MFYLGVILLCIALIIIYFELIKHNQKNTFSLKKAIIGAMIWSFLTFNLQICRRQAIIHLRSMELI